MTDVPRRAEPSGADKVAVIADRAAPGALAGNTQWHRPQSVKQPTAQNADPNGGRVITGDTFYDTRPDAHYGSVAISSTVPVDGQPTPDPAAAPASALGANSTAIGPNTHADQDEAVAIGYLVNAVGNGAVGLGWEVDVYGDRSIALGAGSTVGSSGSPAVAAAAIGPLAHASESGDVVIGYPFAHVKVPGDFILFDTSGGMWKLVVSTGGALSTVAYP